ncbi:kinesin-5 isoform X2 [Carex littledalei]|uniref:Kinesin-like protein n=1 Tax=Carex littledalei TaxID=544730 RepID=A0A833QI89_9POAL|nr:kinesin-5 isoform X2 [Carex littledalei]
MSSFRPPTTPRSPLKKENFDEASKRRRVGLTKTTGPANPRARSVLSTINAGAGVNAGAQSDNMSDAASTNGSLIEFTCKEDVERLLAEKLRTKKNDIKGKCEQQSEYIKKLRLCITWTMEQVDSYLAEQESLKTNLEGEQKRHSELESALSDKISQLTATLEELMREMNSIQEALKKEEARKIAAIEAYENEKSLKQVADSSLANLREELEKVREEAKWVRDQLKMVQDNSKRLQEYNTSLQQYNSNLQEDKAKHEETIEKLSREKNAMSEYNCNLKDQVGSLRLQLAASQSSQQEALSQRDNLRDQLQTVTAACNTACAKVESLEAQLESVKETLTKQLELVTFEASELEVCFVCMYITAVIICVPILCQLADSSGVQAITRFENADRTIRDLREQLARAEARISEGEALRKRLHNTILELKGNIRVFCRVRPFITDGNVYDGSAISFPTSTDLVGRGIDLANQTQKYSFAFDRVFGPDSSQQDVFVEISQLVQSALDGYKVCIFAYGQTGSGKTYTMMGRQSSEGEKGMIPRSLHQIFKTTRALTSEGWEYCIQASMLEIYNETIRDLLLPGRPGVGPEASNGKQYNIKHDANGNTIVSDLTIEDVHSQEDVDRILRQAEQSRSVGRTQMNEQSSRSHCVFTLRISGVNKKTEQQVQGVLNLIDLAGSERLAKSGATGDRLKETQAINKSLSALSDVIFSLAKKEDHVPFRNSKLTYLLQPCLGGDSKTLMFVNVSPEVPSAGETLCSLRFAARVNSCEIGVPRRQTQQMKLLDSRP